MSYVAFITNRFDEVSKFYSESLGFSIVEQWDRINGRGQRFDSGGMLIEIIDNEREKNKCELGTVSERVHVVIEVDNIDEARGSLKIDAPAVQDTSWGARLFKVNDPDGIPVTFLQWMENK